MRSAAGMGAFTSRALRSTLALPPPRSRDAQRSFRMSERTVSLLSDQTGVTAETLGYSLLTQFDGQQFRQVTLPFIDTDDKAREAVKKINDAARMAALRPIVFSTLVKDDFRAIVREADGLHLDIFDV